MRAINISEFKAKCLAILQEVSRTSEPITVLKHGRPLVLVSPAVGEASEIPQRTLLRTVEIVGDIIAPVTEPEAWDAEKGQL